MSKTEISPVVVLVELDINTRYDAKKKRLEVALMYTRLRKETAIQVPIASLRTSTDLSSVYYRVSDEVDEPASGVCGMSEAVQNCLVGIYQILLKKYGLLVQLTFTPEVLQFLLAAAVSGENADALKARISA
jgi:hypothetical protein